ncbi:MAG: GWxTD domain-containing protein [Bacteroidetes bacterium]|nr:MAG: GWxTD domain-containing protein [Bacteroidota bacterium]
MRNSVYTIFFLLFSVSSLAKLPSIEVFMSQYWHPASGPYIELYVFSDPSTLRFEPIDSKFQSGIQIDIHIKDGDETIAEKSEQVLSPALLDTNNSFEIVHLMKLAIPDGKWQIELKLSDIYGQYYKVLKDSIEIVGPKAFMLSRLQLTLPVAPSPAWNRYGIPVYPKSLEGVSYFPTEDTLIQLYSEIYQPKDEDAVAVYTSFIEANSGRTVSNSERVFRKSAAPLTPLAVRYDIRELPTGSYFAKLWIKNREGVVIASDSVKFGRYNTRVNTNMELELPPDYISFIPPNTSLEDLKRMVDCLHPISTDHQIIQARGLVKDGDSTQLHNYVDAFWNRQSPTNPAVAFNQYMERIAEADERFGMGNRPGYLTDRGRVWMQYGEPSNTESSNFDNATYPWEIWRYDRLLAPNRPSQVNKVFIFVNRDVAGNNFRLEHSDANGENYNPQWKYQVNRVGTPPGIDGRSSNTNSDPFGTRLNNNSIMNGSTSSGYERR